MNNDTFLILKVAPSTGNIVHFFVGISSCDSKLSTPNIYSQLSNKREVANKRVPGTFLFVKVKIHVGGTFISFA